MYKLVANVVLKTTENFQALCTCSLNFEVLTSGQHGGAKGIGGSTQQPLHSKGTIFHCIVKGFIAQEQ
ncbi:unnamed protein product [Urochloa humidicola]